MMRSMSFTSARPGALALVAAVCLAFVISGCPNRDAQDPSAVDPYGGGYAQQPGGYGQQPGAYGQPPAGGYGQQPAYPAPGQYPAPQQPQPAPGAYPGAAPAPAPSAAATPAPSPLALPCQNDLICGTHKCNLQTGRCALPCGSSADCMAGFSCMGAGSPTAICVPGGGQ